MGDVKLAAVIGLVLGALGLRYVAVSAAAAIAFGGLGGSRGPPAMGRGRKGAIPLQSLPGRGCDQWPLSGGQRLAISI